jgi:hypothetical protein
VENMPQLACIFGALPRRSANLSSEDQKVVALHFGSSHDSSLTLRESEWQIAER